MKHGRNLNGFNVVQESLTCILGLLMDYGPFHDLDKPALHLQVVNLTSLLTLAKLSV